MIRKLSATLVTILILSATAFAASGTPLAEVVSHGESEARELGRTKEEYRDDMVELLRRENKASAEELELIGKGRDNELDLNRQSELAQYLKKEGMKKLLVGYDAAAKSKIAQAAGEELAAFDKNSFAQDLNDGEHRLSFPDDFHENRSHSLFAPAVHKLFQPAPQEFEVFAAHRPGSKITLLPDGTAVYAEPLARLKGEPQRWQMHRITTSSKLPGTYETIAFKQDGGWFLNYRPGVGPDIILSRPLPPGAAIVKVTSLDEGDGNKTVIEMNDGSRFEIRANGIQIQVYTKLGQRQVFYDNRNIKKVEITPKVDLIKEEDGRFVLKDKDNQKEIMEVLPPSPLQVVRSESIDGTQTVEMGGASHMKLQVGLDGTIVVKWMEQNHLIATTLTLEKLEKTGLEFPEDKLKLVARKDGSIVLQEITPPGEVPGREVTLFGASEGADPEMQRRFDRARTLLKEGSADFNELSKIIAAYPTYSAEKKAAIEQAHELPIDQTYAKAKILKDGGFTEAERSALLHGKVCGDEPKYKFTKAYRDHILQNGGTAEDVQRARVEMQRYRDDLLNYGGPTQEVQQVLADIMIEHGGKIVDQHAEFNEFSMGGTLIRMPDGRTEHFDQIVMIPDSVRNDIPDPRGYSNYQEYLEKYYMGNGDYKGPNVPPPYVEKGQRSE